VPPRPAEADAIALIRAGLDLGVDFVDTADVYCRDDGDLGHNERLFAAGLSGHPRREAVRVATKGGLRRPGGAWVESGRPEALRAACERSLRALAVERIDLYQLHAPDHDVPFEESVGTLFDLRAEGHIAHVGLSNVSAGELRSALTIGPVVSVQNQLHPLDLSAIEEGVLQACEQAGVAFIAYSPVGGRHDRAAVLGHPDLRAVGAQLGVGAGTVALAWLLTLSPAILTIPGASRLTSLQASLAACALTLPPDARHRLDHAFGFARSEG
jgi:aryl-alcohol dehydrogenase-like predicted oxidoreductase